MSNISDTWQTMLYALHIRTPQLNIFIQTTTDIEAAEVESKLTGVNIAYDSLENLTRHNIKKQKKGVSQLGIEMVLKPNTHGSMLR